MHSDAVPLPQNMRVEAPPDSSVLHVGSDGNCMYYAFLSFLLGKPVMSSNSVVSVFRHNLMDLVLKHRKVFCTESTSSPAPHSHIIHFSHSATHHCCHLWKTQKDGYHQNFCWVRVAKRWERAYNLEQWTDIHRKSGTWGGSEILTILCCLTGFTVFTYTGLRADTFSRPYYIFNSRPEYGGLPRLPGGEILLTHAGNHYELLVPGTTASIPLVVKPYVKKPSVELVVLGAKQKCGETVTGSKAQSVSAKTSAKTTKHQLKPIVPAKTK